MEDNKKVFLKSNVYGRVGIDIPELRFKRIWEDKGVVKAVPFEIMQELLYTEGMEQSLRDGVFVIEDMEMKKALGLEPEDATEPTNLIVLNDKQKENLLKNKPIAEFKNTVKDMSYAQIKDLANLAINNGITVDLEKCEFIKKMIDIDIMACIENKKLAEEK